MQMKDLKFNNRPIIDLNGPGTSGYPYAKETGSLPHAKIKGIRDLGVRAITVKRSGHTNVFVTLNKVVFGIKK